MEKKIINDQYIKEVKYLKNTCNSIQYVDDNDLIKYFYEPDCGDSNEKREERLKLLDTIVEEDFILPKYAIYLDNYKTANLKGYGMDYLKDYETINSVLNNDDYSHKDKLEICKKLSNIFTSLEKYKISYWDIHSGNILIKEKNIKICDMDSATSKRIDGEYLYRVDLSDSYRYLTSLMLSILYDIDEFNLINILQKKKSRSFVKKSEMFSRVANTDGYIFYPDKYLDDFTEDYVEETKKLLKR